MNKYWVKYRYRIAEVCEECVGRQDPHWKEVSIFVDTDDLEGWWEQESSGAWEHELLHVSKL